MGTMDYSEQIGRIKRLSELFRIVREAADATGVGVAVMEEILGILPCVCAPASAGAGMQKEKYSAHVPKKKLAIVRLKI